MTRTITRILRTIRRRTPNDLIIEIGPYGIKVREPGSKRGVDVSYQDIIARKPARTRREAFERQPPKDWSPAFGDAVYIRAGTKYAKGTVLQICPDHLLIGFPTGKPKEIALENLRPA